SSDLAKIFGFFYRRGRKGRRAATKEKVKNSPRRHEQRTHSKIFGFILNALNLPASVADCARSAPYAVSSSFSLNWRKIVNLVRRCLALAVVVASTLPFASWALAQQFSPDLFQPLHWRAIGPFRGGRTKAAAGVPSQPNVFYVGVCNGGVWKTTDYGRTWAPIFDQQPTGSIGAVSVALSDPNVIYVGSGEGLHRPDLSVGDGIYKSTDAGKTWTHLGLRDGQ